jgi:Gram-negative bacterial TonB protein C-terminal
MHHAVDAGCRPGECKILVTDFVFPDGAPFPNGIQWADDLSSLFVSQEKKIQVVGRDLFKNLLQKEQISAKLQNSEPAARWLGKQFDASVVLVGKARMIGETIVELSARFLNVNDKNLIGPSSEVNLQVISPKTDIGGLTGLPAPLPLPSFPDTVDGEKVYQMGVGGVGFPNCYYMPSPRMTEAATAVEFSGIVLVEAAVGTDGAVRAVQIMKGAPFGLGDEFVKVVKTWKCKPAQLDGKPVAVITQFEANFGSGPLH